MNEPHIFISHSWAYDKNYNDLINLLNSRGYFNFKDYSIPKNDRLNIRSKVNYESILKEKIKEKMKLCQVVLVIAGVYASYSDSIKLEIEAAMELGKPIIAVRPYGASRVSSIVENMADRFVNWNADSIVCAIREFC